MADWFYMLDGKEQGPISEEDLRHIFASGALPITTPVWCEGVRDWTEAAAVTELNDTVPRPARPEALISTEDAREHSRSSTLHRRSPLPKSVVCVVIPAFCLLVLAWIGWNWKFGKPALAKQKSITTSDVPNNFVLEQYRQQQDTRIENAIDQYGWEIVTKGYLKAWGSQVSIGQVFSVIAPRARWSAGRLAAYEVGRYSHYLVQADWTNDKGEPVAMQYLVAADGSEFHLHGCFVSGHKIEDSIFLASVTAIWKRYEEQTVRNQRLDNVDDLTLLQLRGLSRQEALDARTVMLSYGFTVRDTLQAWDQCLDPQSHLSTKNLSLANPQHIRNLLEVLSAAREVYK